MPCTPRFLRVSIVAVLVMLLAASAPSGHEGRAVASLSLSALDDPGQVAIHTMMQGTSDAEATPADGEGELDLSKLEGFERAVGRTYIGDETALSTPETAPAQTYYLAAAVARFDSAEHAASGMAAIHDAFLTSTVGADAAYTYSEVDVGALGDQALAQLGTAKEGGMSIEVAFLTVQDGAYIYVAAAIGVGEQSGAMDTATSVARSMLDADEGEGDGTFDESGGSTGGLWDKLPTESDPVLQGLMVESDSLVVPEDGA